MDMFVLTVVACLMLVAIAGIIKFFDATLGEKEEIIKSPYVFRKKPYLMTVREQRFFARLIKLVQHKYYVFPQIHLDEILDHKVKGQNWRAALSSIQRKSLDFVLVEKESMVTTYGVELDDYTHEGAERVRRDRLVESILEQAGVKLIRFRGFEEMSDEEIIQKFIDAND